MSKFIGREKELQKLETLLQKKSSSLIVIRGRRLIGKSRLIQEFCTEKTHFVFSGIPPTPKTSNESQRNEFAEQMSRNLRMPLLKNLTFTVYKLS